jgi:hypothetical protein
LGYDKADTISCLTRGINVWEGNRTKASCHGEVIHNQRRRKFTSLLAVEMEMLRSYILKEVF